MALRASEESVLVFDMDGVLVDVSESYRAAITKTVEHFTGRTIVPELIQEYKNAGGWNNDWTLARRIVFDTAGMVVPYKEVIGVFQQHFLGENNDGLILRERWLPDNGLLEKLAKKHQLAIFTGRPRGELDLTLRRFASGVQWSMIVADGDVPKAKPAPDGLVAIAGAYAERTLSYIGDTVDDARSARAAGVRFIGVAHGRSPGLRDSLMREGAAAVIENINEIETKF